MQNHEGVPETEDQEMPSFKPKVEEDEKKIEEEDVFDQPVEKQTQVKKKGDIPYFLNKIEIPKLLTNKMIERGNKEELEREYHKLFS